MKKYLRGGGQFNVRDFNLLFFLYANGFRNRPNKISPCVLEGTLVEAESLHLTVLIIMQSFRTGLKQNNNRKLPT